MLPISATQLSSNLTELGYFSNPFKRKNCDFSKLTLLRFEFEKLVFVTIESSSSSFAMFELVRSHFLQILYGKKSIFINGF